MNDYFNRFRLDYEVNEFKLITTSLLSVSINNRRWLSWSNKNIFLPMQREPNFIYLLPNFAGQKYEARKFYLLYFCIPLMKVSCYELSRPRPRPRPRWRPSRSAKSGCLCEIDARLFINSCTYGTAGVHRGERGECF